MNISEINDLELNFSNSAIRRKDEDIITWLERCRFKNNASLRNEGKDEHLNLYDFLEAVREFSITGYKYHIISDVLCSQNFNSIDLIEKYLKEQNIC